jgi:3-hydroxybutyryl-CoA dehydrogenase
VGELDPDTLGIVGAGVMGRGIAQVAISAGRRVLLCDVDLERVEEARREVSRRLDRLVEKGTLLAGDRAAAMERLVPIVGLGSLAACPVVIEAATESLELKRGIISQLEVVCDTSAILATNTSSLSITEIAAVALDPRRVVGIHFFNPAPVMRLVEIIPGSETSDETVQAAWALATELGKQPVLAIDRPGFIVSRVLDVMVNEAIRCVMDGNTPEDVDTAMRLGANLPIGPLALADLMGLDVLKSVMERLQAGFDSDAYAPAPLLLELVERGHLGRKMGQGFYAYPDR